MTNEELDWMIEKWVEFRHKEFKEVSWPTMSMMGKMIEQMKVGIFATGTRHQIIADELPEWLDLIQIAIARLPLSQRQVIIMEYECCGSQFKKSKQLGIKLHNYKARLLRARKTLKLYLT